MQLHGLREVGQSCFVFEVERGQQLSCLILISLVVLDVLTS